MKQIHISLQAFKCAKIKAIKEKFVFLKYIYIYIFFIVLKDASKSLRM